MNETNQFTPLNKTRSQRISTKELVLTGMFTALISVMAQLSVPIQPIPFTLVLFAIFLTGALLPPRSAFLAVLAYLLIGAVGVPVFANFSGGVQDLVGATGGYLMAFPVMAFITALFNKHIPKYKIVALALGMIISLIICYLFGTFWFTITNTKGIGFYDALTYCVFPFVLFDCVKIVLAISVSFVIRKTVFRSLLRND